MPEIATPFQRLQRPTCFPTPCSWQSVRPQLLNVLRRTIFYLYFCQCNRCNGKYKYGKKCMFNIFHGNNPFQIINSINLFNKLHQQHYFCAENWHGTKIFCVSPRFLICSNISFCGMICFNASCDKRNLRSVEPQ